MLARTSANARSLPKRSAGMPITAKTKTMAKASTGNGGRGPEIGLRESHATPRMIAAAGNPST